LEIAPFQVDRRSLSFWKSIVVSEIICERRNCLSSKSDHGQWSTKNLMENGRHHGLAQFQIPLKIGTPSVLPLSKVIADFPVG
jgi:hypothetical protein